MPESESKDTNEVAAELVRNITRMSIAPKGEELLGSEELKRKFREAKDQEAKRHKGKN